MEEIITERLQEIVQEINSLLENRNDMVMELKKLDDHIIAKKGAIFELKQLLEFEDKTKD